MFLVCASRGPVDVETVELLLESTSGYDVKKVRESEALTPLFS